MSFIYWNAGNCICSNLVEDNYDGAEQVGTAKRVTYWGFGEWAAAAVNALLVVDLNLWCNCLGCLHNLLQLASHWHCFDSYCEQVHQVWSCQHWWAKLCSLMCLADHKNMKHWGWVISGPVWHSASNAVLSGHQNQKWSLNVKLTSLVLLTLMH